MNYLIQSDCLMQQLVGEFCNRALNFLCRQALLFSMCPDIVCLQEVGVVGQKQEKSPVEMGNQHLFMGFYWNLYLFLI